MEDPRELFGMRLAHVGVNAADAQDAAEVAALFGGLLGLEVTTTPISHFVGTVVEVMDGGGRGEHGHIGLAVDDLPAAAAWFAANGRAIDESSWAYRPDGSPRLVYFRDPVAGFAVHLMQA